MAKKRRIRRKRTLSAKGGRRRRSSRKGILSEMFTPATAMASGKAVLSGVVGGMASRVVGKIIPGENKLTSALVNLGASFLASSVLKMPNLGAGIAGAYGAQIFDQLAGGMSEDNEETDYASVNGLDKYPDALDENGNPLFLSEDGNFYYLEEMELAESFQDTNMYPRYINSANF